MFVLQSFQLSLPQVPQLVDQPPWLQHLMNNHSGQKTSFTTSLVHSSKSVINIGVEWWKGSFLK